MILAYSPAFIHPYPGLHLKLQRQVQAHSGGASSSYCCSFAYGPWWRRWPSCLAESATQTSWRSVQRARPGPYFPCFVSRTTMGHCTALDFDRLSHRVVLCCEKTVFMNRWPECNRNAPAAVTALHLLSCN